MALILPYLYWKYPCLIHPRTALAFFHGCVTLVAHHHQFIHKGLAGHGDWHTSPGLSHTQDSDKYYRKFLLYHIPAHPFWFVLVLKHHICLQCYCKRTSIKIHIHRVYPFLQNSVKQNFIKNASVLYVFSDYICRKNGHNSSHMIGVLRNCIKIKEYTSVKYYNSVVSIAELLMWVSGHCSIKML